MSLGHRQGGLRRKNASYDNFGKALLDSTVGICKLLNPINQSLITFYLVQRVRQEYSDPWISSENVSKSKLDREKMGVVWRRRLRHHRCRRRRSYAVFRRKERTTRCRWRSTRLRVSSLRMRRTNWHVTRWRVRKRELYESIDFRYNG